MSLPSPAEIAAALIARDEMPAEKGDIGPQGMEGKAGEFGPPGPQGAKGDPGRNGTNGSNGLVGPKGPIGPGGPRGPKGEKGDKGDEGERGPIGPMGPTGAVGSGKALFPRPGGGSSGGAPSGAAGGDLSGTYPNPSVVNDSHSHTGSTLPADLQNIVDNWAVDTDGRALINLASSGGAAQDGVSIVADELPSDTVDLLTIRVPAVLPDTGEYQLFNVASDGSTEHKLANDQSTAVLIDDILTGTGGSFELLKVTGLASRPGKFIAEIGEGSAPVSKGFKVGSGGFIIAKHNAAPADGDLVASDVGLWFDATDGAAAPKWKGKQADGTVVSGSLGLPGSAQTYTESNVTTDRAFNANATSIDELADVLGTLIVDLRARGVVA